MRLKKNESLRNYKLRLSTTNILIPESKFNEKKHERTNRFAMRFSTVSAILHLLLDLKKSPNILKNNERMDQIKQVFEKLNKILFSNKIDMEESIADKEQYLLIESNVLSEMQNLVHLASLDSKEKEDELNTLLSLVWVVVDEKQSKVMSKIKSFFK